MPKNVTLALARSIRAIQTPGRVTLYATGDKPNPGSSVTFVKAKPAVFPPEHLLVLQLPAGPTPQILVPFHTETTFKITQIVDEVVVYDSRGKHVVPVEHAMDFGIGAAAGIPHVFAAAAAAGGGGAGGQRPSAAEIQNAVCQWVRAYQSPPKTPMSVLLNSPGMVLGTTGPSHAGLSPAQISALELSLSNWAMLRGGDAIPAGTLNGTKTLKQTQVIVGQCFHPPVAIP
jgi:hypothetical protein